MLRKASSSRPRRQPSYRLHKARGTAVVTIDGKNLYLGKYDSPESHEKYARLIAQWQANGRVTPAEPPEGNSSALTVSELILQYLEHAEVYYKDYGDKHHGEISNLRYALRPLRLLYGCISSIEFSPEALENVRQRMIDEGLARTTINGRITRIKRAFRWAAQKGLVSPSVYHGLKTVDGLKRGRSAAKESEPVKPVPESDIKATLLHLNSHVSAMVQVQELSGMRPQDVRNMRTCDIDRTRDVWVYEPHTHKNEHHGHPRKIAIGPKAQSILKPYLKPDTPEAYLFSPREAADAVNAERMRNRVTPMTPSQKRRTRKAKPKRKPGEQYTKNSYRGAIVRACEKAGVSRWHPHQLRHNCGTKVRQLYGLDGAVAVLGHKLGIVTEIYAEQDFQKAVDIMRKIG